MSVGSEMVFLNHDRKSMKNMKISLDEAPTEIILNENKKSNLFVNGEEYNEKSYDNSGPALFDKNDIHTIYITVIPVVYECVLLSTETRGLQFYINVRRRRENIIHLRLHQ